MWSVKLGETGPVVSVVGFGAWGLSGDYGPADDAQSVLLLRQAIDLGITLIDTADEYGNGHNERVVGTAVRGLRSEVVLATKVGLVPASRGSTTIDGQPSPHPCCGRPLPRSTWCQARQPPAPPPRRSPRPLEDSVGAMAELQTDGRVRHLGLSEVSSEQLRAAHGGGFGGRPERVRQMEPRSRGGCAPDCT